MSTDSNFQTKSGSNSLKLLMIPESVRKETTTEPSAASSSETIFIFWVKEWFLLTICCPVGKRSSVQLVDALTVSVDTAISIASSD